jgi:hypothetical protein
VVTLEHQAFVSPFLPLQLVFCCGRIKRDETITFSATGLG